MISIISFPGNIKILLSYNPYHTKKTSVNQVQYKYISRGFSSVTKMSIAGQIRALDQTRLG